MGSSQSSALAALVSAGLEKHVKNVHMHVHVCMCVERFAIGSNAVSCICGYLKLGNLLVFNFIFVAESLLKLSLQFYHSSNRYKLWCTALPKKGGAICQFYRACRHVQ